MIQGFAISVDFFGLQDGGGSVGATTGGTASMAVHPYIGRTVDWDSGSKIN